MRTRSILLTAGILTMSLAPIGSASAQIYDWTTIAGAVTNSGSADGTNSTARFNNPHGVAVDTNGNLYVADVDNHTIRKVTLVGTNWVVSTIAGAAGVSGAADGTNSDARFKNPPGVAVDTNGNLYVMDTGNHTIRKVTPVGTDWVTSTIAGLAGNNGDTDGTNSDARFEAPFGIALDGDGNVYVADTNSHTIRKVTPVGTNWVTTTIAGSAGNYGTTDGTNNNAQFHSPRAVAVDGSGNLYVADLDNYTIRKITPVVGANWVTTTIAGSAGSYGTTDGTNSDARFYSLVGVAVDTNGNLYVTDFANHTIRKITPVGTNWVTSTIGGLAGNAGSADGLNSAARFNYPYGVAVNGSGNLYVAEYGNHIIRLGVPLLLLPVIDSIVISNVFATVGSNTIVVAGDNLGFTVTAHPTYLLSYLWDFGDGSDSAWSLLNTATHTYSTSNNCGLYTVTAIVSNAAGVGSSNLPVTVACQLSVTKLHANVNFNPAKSNIDSCALTARLDLDAGYNLTNKLVSLDIGGADVSFNLDAKGKGRGVGTYGNCKLLYKKRTGPWTFTTTLKKGSWAAQWETYGLTNATTNSVSVTLPVTLVIGNEGFYGEKPLLYKAKLNKSGTAK